MKNNFLQSFSDNALKQVSTLSDIVFCVENNCELSELIKSKGLFNCDIVCESTYLLKGQYIVIKPKKYKIHVVKPNQTLSEIAAIYELPSNQILQNNNITNIFVGQQLKIY